MHKLKTLSRDAAPRPKCCLTALFEGWRRQPGPKPLRPRDGRLPRVLPADMPAKCGQRSNPGLHARPVSGSPDTPVQRAAERELAAFHEAVLRSYGPQEATQAAQDWIEALERLDRPVGGALPDWRRVTVAAARSLAARVAAEPASC